MISALRLKLAILLNRFRRRNGPSFPDRCVSVIMRMCALQLPKDVTRQLAGTKGMVGAALISGGAITKITYRVFDKHADRVDPSTRLEPWRAFLVVTMRIYIDRDPEWQVEMQLQTGEAIEVEPKDLHKQPGIELVKHLGAYFPLLPEPFKGRTYAPSIEGTT